MRTERCFSTPLYCPRRVRTPRLPMKNAWKIVTDAFRNWRTAAKYLGVGSGVRRGAIADRRALAEFMDSRASHVAQTALYGYLKTRSGTRFPQLFEHPEYLKSINIAKWQVWLAALSDISVYAGGLIHRGRGTSADDVGRIVSAIVNDILARTGIPDEAGPDFATQTERVRARIGSCDWASIGDDESAFTASPAALIDWAPVVDEFKKEDDQIVRNSVRFRWIEVRRSLRANLNVEDLIAAESTLVECDTEAVDSAPSQ